jgi:hypothetical protein
MGTWASFYIHDGENTEFVGGVNCDGDPNMGGGRQSGVPVTICRSKTVKTYRERIAKYLAELPYREVIVVRKPWIGFDISDYSYCFMQGEVYIRHGSDHNFMPARVMLKLRRVGQSIFDSFTEKVPGTGVTAVPILRGL